MVLTPSAQAAASSIAMPARMSGEVIGAPFSRLGPATIARCGSQSTMRPPIAISLSTKNIRDSNIFSNIRMTPSHCVAVTIAIVTASQCEGVILMFEKMFESRMFFVDKLISMGARIVLCDPHSAIVAGPSKLRGASMISPDIRAGMAMLLAAVCAEGTSTINNADQIERGYERIDERLNALGAKITRVPARER